ncbi:MAG TPA: enoyl-CoA hydratase-related protein [Actinomycetota bacterium]|jgi:enoyl-CoA hydratase/carnithine racemase|nr:enoyl-CoA hydratase-related protein [Actinomycetota bacterium]
MGEFVRIEADGAVATIRLDRPPANVLNERMSRELWDSSREVAGDDAIRAVVVWGGQRRFSGGADITEMVGFGPREVDPVVGALEGALRHMEAIPKVVIAAVNGYALGGGCEVALAADFRFAAEDAQFGQTEIALGIIPGAGGTQRLPRLIGLARAREMIYTGRRVSADEALAIGLVDRVFAPDEVYPAALEEAARYAEGPSLALRAAKMAVNAAAQTDQERGLELERGVFRDLFVSLDQEEGMRAFLEKRRPRFEGR